MVLLKGYPETATAKLTGVKTGPAAGEELPGLGIGASVGEGAHGVAFVVEVPTGSHDFCSGCGARRAALHRRHAAHRRAPWSPTGVLQRPTSAPGPV